MINYKFSIVTPEHDRNNIPYLIELYETIKSQTYTNWEWVLYLNNNCAESDLPSNIIQDNNVKVFISPDSNTNVGCIKNRAFHCGEGDVLVEVDHDDLITPNCLEELNKAYQDQSIGFVYSDNAVLHMTSEFIPFSETYGWTFRKFNWKGQDLIAMNSFEPSSHSVGYIWYAPDHVRSWRTSVYKDIGGHNPDLSICDDHELMIRTYLYTNMKRIPEVLYIYRVTGNNTWLQRNEMIQQKTVELFNTYARSLAERDANKQNLLKIDIGAGINPYPGYTTIDMREDSHIVYDLNNGIPLPDNSVGVLNASHIIEHLHDKHKTMSEIHRVLAPGGWAFIEVPSTDGRGAFQDPTHVSYWNENSFFYYTHAGLAMYIDNSKIRFQQYRKQTWFPNEWMRTINACVVTAWLVAVKNNVQRFPGELHI